MGRSAENAPAPIVNEIPMRSLKHTLAALALALPASASFAVQDGAPPPPEDQEVAPAEQAPQDGSDADEGVPMPATVEEAVDLANSVGDEVEDIGAERAQAFLATYLELAREQVKTVTELADAAEGSSDANLAAQRRADLDTLLASAERIMARLAELDVTTEEAAAEIAAIRDRTTSRGETGGAPQSRETAIGMDLEVLRARLRPLLLEEVQERIQPWRDLLKATCVEIADIEVASLTAESDEDVQRFQARAVLLRQERSKLIDRVRVVLDSAEDKGGDVAEPRAYLESVVATPKISGFKAFMTTSVTWVKSADGGIAVAIAAFIAIAIIIAAFVLSRLLGRVARRAMKSVAGASHLLRDFVVAAVKRGTIVIGLLVALSTLGINMSPLLAAIGAAGLVIGLALQGTLGNLASGLMIMVFRPFDEGDVVETGGATGKVVGLSLMTTEIRTFDNRTIYVPNNRIWGDVITNVTANATRRVDMKFGVSYGDDAGRARAIAEEVLANHPKILKDPAPVVRVHELADSSVNLIVRPWSLTADYWDVFWDITAQMKDAYDNAGISIPFPQRDVHMIPAVSGGGADTPASETSDQQQEAAT